jgi:hypothetical protein
MGFTKGAADITNWAKLWSSTSADDRQTAGSLAGWLKFSEEASLPLSPDEQALIDEQVALVTEGKIPEQVAA